MPLSSLINFTCSSIVSLMVVRGWPYMCGCDTMKGETNEIVRTMKYTLYVLKYLSTKCGMPFDIHG